MQGLIAAWNQRGNGATEEMTDAYKAGRDAYGEWFEKTRSTTIDGTEPDNPYPIGTTEHKEWQRGAWDENQTCVLIQMGR